MGKAIFDSQWKTLSRNDWNEILVLLEKQAYQRKFKIIEAFIELVGEKGFHRVSHSEIAKKCGVTRQLVDHHFPTETSLVALSYRLIYARFQKVGSDAIISKMGFANQFKSYIFAVADWMQERPNEAYFLVQFYALSNLDLELHALHVRNTRIGQERIAALCKAAQAEGLFRGLAEQEALARASIVQMLIMGFLVQFNSEKRRTLSEEAKQNLYQACIQLLERPPTL